MAFYIGAHFLLVFFVRYYLTCKIPPYKNYLTFWEWKETIATVSFALAPRTRSDKTAKCKFSWLLHSKLLWPGSLISLHSDCRRNALSEAGHHSAGVPSHILFACSPNKDFLDKTHLLWDLLLSRWVSFGSLATCFLWKCPQPQNILCWCNLLFELTDSVVVVVVVVIVIYLLSTS